VGASFREGVGTQGKQTGGNEAWKKIPVMFGVVYARLLNLVLSIRKIPVHRFEKMRSGDEPGCFDAGGGRKARRDETEKGFPAGP